MLGEFGHETRFGLYLNGDRVQLRDAYHTSQAIGWALTRNFPDDVWRAIASDDAEAAYLATLHQTAMDTATNLGSGDGPHV